MLVLACPNVYTKDCIRVNIETILSSSIVVVFVTVGILDGLFYLSVSSPQHLYKELHIYVNRFVTCAS